MLKVMGALLLVAGGAALGTLAMGELKGKLAFIRAMDNALGLMAGEIELCARPLPELFELLAERAQTPARDFFRLLGGSMELLSAREAWETACRMPSLPPGAVGALLPLGAVLGSYDAVRQCAEIQLARRELETEARRLGERLASRARNWPALGACAAAVAALLIT